MTIRPYRDGDLEPIQRITVESFEGVSIDRNVEAHFGKVAGRTWQERNLEAMCLGLTWIGARVAGTNGDVASYHEARRRLRERSM